MQKPFLATLDEVKTWGGVTTADSDALLTTLLGQVSRAVMSYLNRPSLFQRVVNEMRDGSGSDGMTLRQWPVTSVASVVVGSQAVPASSGYGQVGWTLEPWDGYAPGTMQRVTLQGSCFWQATNNVRFLYTAGYATLAEAQSVPATAPYNVTSYQAQGAWGQDIGVTYADGIALVSVTSAPAAGQYSVTPEGVYSFAAADAGAAVLLSYSFVPADVSEAVAEVVVERYRYKERVGTKSQGVQGETSSFDVSGLTVFAKALLNPYRRTLPI